MTKITTLKGKTVEAVYSTGSYIIIRLSRGMEIQIDTGFDKHGERYENDAPPLPTTGKGK